MRKIYKPLEMITAGLVTVCMIFMIVTVVAAVFWIASLCIGLFGLADASMMLTKGCLGIGLFCLLGSVLTAMIANILKRAEKNK